MKKTKPVKGAVLLAENRTKSPYKKSARIKNTVMPPGPAKGYTSKKGK